MIHSNVPWNSHGLHRAMSASWIGQISNYSFVISLFILSITLCLVELLGHSFYVQIYMLWFIICINTSIAYTLTYICNIFQFCLVIVHFELMLRVLSHWFFHIENNFFMRMTPTPSAFLWIFLNWISKQRKHFVYIFDFHKILRWMKVKHRVNR